MSRIVLALVAAPFVALAPIHADPGELSVADYLKAWDSLDTAALKKEIEETGEIDFEKHPNARIAMRAIGETAKAYRAKVNEDLEAGQAPHSCLPAETTNINSDKFLPHLKSYDEAVRGNITLAEAFADLMAKTYPCD